MSESSTHPLPAAAAPQVRVAAARAAAAVFAGSSMDDVLAMERVAFTIQQRSFLQALVYGVVRDRRVLEALAGLLQQRPQSGEPEVAALLLVGLYQLRSMRIAPHAAVAETVAATLAMEKPWAKSFVNAILRRYQRESAALEAQLPQTPNVQLSYPDWLVTAIRDDWPRKWREVLAAGNEPGPLTLRINRRLRDRDTWLTVAAVAGIVAEPLPFPDAVRQLDITGVERIPGFADGEASVQDASAQLAAGLLAVETGQRVLDACAAPGGKTAHLLERYDRLDVTAVDREAGRLARVRENLDRLGLDAQLIAADAIRPSTWWDGRLFDRILLDAPCSGTGVIRRHPDIKWLRRASDIKTLAATQGRLLEALWPLLVPGGVLLYATCSILRAEGEEPLRRFVSTHADADEWPIEADWGEACTIGRRIAPGGNHDGFFYGRLRKR